MFLGKIQGKGVDFAEILSNFSAGPRFCERSLNQNIRCDGFLQLFVTPCPREQLLVHVPPALKSRSLMCDGALILTTGVGFPSLFPGADDHSLGVVPLEHCLATDGSLRRTDSETGLGSE